MELPIPSAHPSPPGVLPHAVLGLGALFLPNKASHIFHISVFLARSPHLVVRSSPFPFQKEKHTQILTESDHGCSELCCALVQTPPTELHQNYW